MATAEYRASCGCCETIPSRFDSIEPRTGYPNGVRGAVLDRLLDDKMSVERLRAAPGRDFRLDPSEGFVHDCLGRKVRQTDGADYRRWAIEQFSGTPCIDEIHRDR